ncbi:DUF654-domain-containing protein [Hypoxylon fuscum]|nr:DUF654-domain-containing protein [Hypoxylon fuscum]
MSSRQLRKLQKQKELEELQAQNPAGDDRSSEEDRPAQKPKANISVFAALGDQDEDDEDDVDETKEEELVEAATKPTTGTGETNTPKGSSKKSKKKKKKAKKQAIPVKKEAGSKGAQDEIDQALKELELSKKTSEGMERSHSFVQSYDRICELLSINTTHLRVINEMRNLFGREAIAAAQTEEEQEQARSRRPRQHLPQQVDLETFLRGKPGQGLLDVTMRRNPFLAGKETWPRAPTEGLTMEQLKEQEGGVVCMPGTVEFRFVHDKNYNALERRFYDIVQAYDPMQIVHFLQLHPYHVSSLIQVSRVAKQDQNLALAADLCERALFTFGRVSISSFRQKIEQGKARLSFKRPENRQFWLAGYHYLKNLIMKGTYRTALEWCKLLLSLNHDDPYGVIHFIHPLAIRAHESKWFIDLCDSEILDMDLAAQDAQDYIRQTLILARLQQQDTAGAKVLLVEGMDRLPWLYSHLFKTLNLDVPKAIWGWQPRNQEEELHTNVYVHQTKSLWDNTQAKSLLKEAANEAGREDICNVLAPPPSVKANLARFVYLLEIPSLIGLIPRGLLDTDVNWEFDPLPPQYEQNIFSYDSQRRPWLSPRMEELLGGPGDPSPEAVAQFIAHARQNGAPVHFQEVLEEFLRNYEGNDHDDDDGEGDEGMFGELPPGDPESTIAGVFQYMMGLFDPNNYGHGTGAGGDELPMPGGWHGDNSSESATEDDMPALIPEYGDSDDEMPPLLPADAINTNDTSNAAPQTQHTHAPSGHSEGVDDDDDEMPPLV